jgi:hypothetical protein
MGNGMCPGVKLEVMGKVGGRSEVSKCQIGCGEEGGWVIGCAQV